MNRSALAAGVRHLLGVAAVQHHREDSDEHLLHAFAVHREDSAFAVLVRRHGPMVLHVCRRVLEQEQDAEDAFQATFLVLARKVASLRKKTALASFLHGTAYRLALNAKRVAGRRRKHESQIPPRSSVDALEELSWPEVRTLLDEEIARLPKIYRSVFILCCLENLGRAEAAQRLEVNENTLSSRLAEARKRLQQRLTRRGVELTAVLGALSLAASPASALSPVLIASTIKAALVATAGEGLVGIVSASVVELVKGASTAMMLSKTKIAAAVLLAVSALAGAGAWTYRTSATPQGAEQAAEAPKQLAASKPRREKDAVVMVKGRVLLPNGKPAANAVIRRRQMNESADAVKETVLTTTAVDGRFEVEYREEATLIASAPGFAPDWTGQEFKGGDLTLTLAEPARVRGRLLNLEGKPVAGARVKILDVNVPVRGNLNAATDAFRLNPEWTWQAMPKTLSAPIPHSTMEAKTDSDGRFMLEGFGTNRILEIQFEAEGIESAKVYVILSASFDPKSVLPRPAERATLMARNRQRATVYGLQFTHTVRPCQVITGVVADEADGKPIAGVKIVGTGGTIHLYYQPAWRDAVETTTDRDGRYRLSGLPKAKERHLHVKAGDAPYLDRLIDVPEVAALAPVVMDIKLRKAMMIEGQLLDKETGKAVLGMASFLPLENTAIARFLSDNPAYSHKYSVRPGGMRAISDAEGRLKLRVPPVPGVILARADTRRDPTARYTAIRVQEVDRKYLRKPSKDREEIPKSRLIGSVLKQEYFDTRGLISPVHWENGYALIHHAKKDEAVKVVIRFDPGRIIHGKIVGPDGRPLAGVQAVGVQATGEHDPTTFRTDSYTIYALDPSRPRTVYFRHKKNNLIGTAILRGDEVEAPRVKMQPAAAVIGRILDAAGKPLAGMEVHIQFSEFEPDERIRQKLHRGEYTLTTTGADGRFRLEGMFPDLEFAVYAGRPGHRSSAVSFRAVTLQAGETRDLGDRREQTER